ncbi:Hypothetical predicted protein [Mytilus galloprovincialis]|uniref:Novel STAND NTPase 3 domain-containing protein n=1 Tax=Mytilus galloprovincialis TaxID=29158 RepID=A0A8B6E8I9_MYTGA|nr:Hypothetical predicted protein [Mytilus galloprovincialis]
MSLSTLRKNFYRIASLIIDHGAESMRCLLDQFIQTKYRMSFRDFVSNHQHEIYHHFNNGICCLCSKSHRRPFKTIISAWQMEKLFDIKNPKLSGHKYSSKCEYCCSIVKSTLQIQDIDITLLRFILVTYFEEEFWQSCFTSGMLFHDYLNTHKHDIFHLLQLNTPCCLCLAHPGYTTMVLTEKDRLNRTQWETMFNTSELPCTQHRNNCPNGKPLKPCSVSATKGIRPSDLDGRARMIILSKFCAMMRHIDVLVNARNTAYAHAVKGELSDKDFKRLWLEIVDAIVYISKDTGTHISRSQSILELLENSQDKCACIQEQCLELEKMKDDNNVLQECRKLYDTVGLIKDEISTKLQQIELQIKDFESTLTDVIKGDFLMQLKEYSDNSRKEIELHEQDEIYVKTASISTVTEQLDRKNIVILIGRAGIGKSTTALQIASIFQQKGYTAMKLEHNLAQNFKTYFVSKNKQLIIFEDLFGRANVRYNEDMHSNLLDVLKPHIYKGISKFIITVRSYNFTDIDEIVAHHKILSEAAVVSLNGNFGLSTMEKEKVLTSHAKHYGLKIDWFQMQKIIKTDPYLGFPQACHLFCSCKNFYDMGYKFFTSPTEELQKEIRHLKRLGNNDIDSALQYCVLVSLMFDTASENRFGTEISEVIGKDYDKLNCFKNVNVSIIAFLYYSLFKTKVTITTDDLKDICNDLCNKYIKTDINYTSYEFQHNTLFQAVLSSFWDTTTMTNIIKYCSYNILSEYVRSYDCPLENNTNYLIVPQSNCSTLANRLCELFHSDRWTYIYKNPVNDSEFTLRLLNEKLSNWYAIKQNMLNCKWNTLFKCIRPSNVKWKSNTICIHSNDKYLIERLIDELGSSFMYLERQVQSYIDKHAFGGFLEDYYNALIERLKIKNDIKYAWDFIRSCVLPIMCKVTNANFSTLKNNRWLLKTIIKMFLLPKLEIWNHQTFEMKHYIEKYGSKQFVMDLNEKFTGLFQSRSNVDNYTWDVIYCFVRPSQFTIPNGKIGTITHDSWLIQRMIGMLVESIADKTSVNQDNDEYYDELKGEPNKAVLEINNYIRMYECDEFVKHFNKTLIKWFQSNKNFKKNSWIFVEYFIRPSSFIIDNGQKDPNTNDRQIIQLLMNILTDSTAEKEWEVKHYIERYGCKQFVSDFNAELLQWFKSEFNVVNCAWKLIYHFIRPTSFKIEIIRPSLFNTGKGQIGSHTNDSWLIDKLISTLIKYQAPQVWEIQFYIQNYGCEHFVKDFNEKLMVAFQSETNVLNCIWKVIDCFVRPVSFQIKKGELGTFTDDKLLTERLINELVTPTALRVWEVTQYIEKYGCEIFDNSFNKKLKEWILQNMTNCYWHLFNSVVRPHSDTLRGEKIRICIDDEHIIAYMFAKLEQTKHVYSVKSYIRSYGSTKFIKAFNEKLREKVKTFNDLDQICTWESLEHYFLS